MVKYKEFKHTQISAEQNPSYLDATFFKGKKKSFNVRLQFLHPSAILHPKARVVVVAHFYIHQHKTHHT